MRFTTVANGCLASIGFLSYAFASNLPAEQTLETRHVPKQITPKVFIFDMFPPEGEAWYGIPEFNLLSHNISVAGFSPLYPDVHCTEDYEVCQLVTGESEINAAATVTALVLSPLFCLEKTYFLIAGIGGISPKEATLGSVTFARFAVQVALQYEFDIRDLPKNFSTGYIPQGSTVPDEYPQSIYGTEVFELNLPLLHDAMAFAKTAKLNDSSDAVAYRANYATKSNIYAAGAAPPSVVQCDVATSDVYYSGTHLGETFENYVHLVTNGSGTYCNTAQEDNASLEALIRGALAKLVDFSRIIVMRTASDFDRPYPGEAATTNLFWANQGGFEPAIQNIYLAGVKVVEGILGGWEKTYGKGVKPTNYIGDIFGTLGTKPDFGPANFNNDPVVKRSMGKHADKRSRLSMKGRERL